MGDDFRVLWIHSLFWMVVMLILCVSVGQIIPLRIHIRSTGECRMIWWRSDKSVNRVNHNSLVLLDRRTMLEVVGSMQRCVRAVFSILARTFQCQLKSASSGGGFNLCVKANQCLMNLIIRHLVCLDKRTTSKVYLCYVCNGLLAIN